VTSVAIVSAVRLYREGLAHALRNHGRVDVVATAGDTDAALEAASTACGVVLVDVTGHESLELIRRLRDAAPDTAVVALGVAEEEDAVLGCAEAGVAGYVTRDDSLEDLVVAVESAARGEARCSPRIAAALLRRVTALSAGAQRRDEPHLTRRELEIVDLIGRGMPNKTIARELTIELPTVKNHVHNILEKLQVTRRADAVAYVRALAAARPPTLPTRAGAPD